MNRAPANGYARHRIMASAPSPRAPRGWSAIYHVAAQELRTSLRDRQTVVNSVVLPIVMYPILFWLILQGFLVVQGHKERTTVEVALVGAPERVAQVQAQWMAELDDGPNHTLLRTDWWPNADVETLRANLRAPKASATQEEHSADRPDAVLRFPDPSSDESAQLFIESTRSQSELAGERTSRLVSQWQRDLRDRAAQEKGLGDEDLDPFDVTSHTITAERDQGAFLLSLFLPMMIVFMAVMGAFFPAVDSTAGEKERGTAETTLLLPLSREHVLLGKILSTSTLAFIATILNLTFMGIAARHLVGTLGPKVPFSIEFPFLALLYSLPLIALFCFFVSAVLTALAGLTKSFKEGQAMLGPAQMAFILPAIVGIMPGLKLSVVWALIPVINVVLAVRAILVMEWLPIPYLTTALVLCASAWLAVRLCVRLLSLEALAFAGSSMSLKDLFRRLRQGRATPVGKP